VTSTPSLVAAIVLVLVTGAARAQPPLRVSWPLASYGGLVEGGMLISIDADLLGVTGVDIATETVRWRTHVQDAPRGGHDLQRLPNGRILLVAGATLVVLDPVTGGIVARHSLPDEPFGARSFLWAQSGICGMNTECAFQPIDCADARPLGDPIRGVLQHRTRFDRSGIDSGCWGFGVDLIGRRGANLVIDVRNHAPARVNAGRPRRTGHVTRLTIDGRTGAIRSQRPVTARRPPPATTPPPSVPALEVLREGAPGARRARVRRISDGAILATLPHDAWWLGAHGNRSVVYVFTSESTPGELRLYAH
jgi:hypothetical protein